MDVSRPDNLQIAQVNEEGRGEVTISEVSTVVSRKRMLELKINYESHMKIKLSAPFCNPLFPVELEQCTFVFGIKNIIHEYEKDASCRDQIEAKSESFTLNCLFDEDTLK